MTLREELDLFYQRNNIPVNGGKDEKTFEMKLLGLKLVLPNPKFRRELIHIHDLQHVLNGKDVSWKGEGFISGWEIATGLWKHFPICFFALWALGYSMWVHPVAVFKGYKKGINTLGIIDLPFSREEFMEMELSQLVHLTKKETSKKMGLLQWLAFVFWVVISQILLLGPLLVVVLMILYW